jgi:tRNA pseudouridine32 synthase / 23S rRNA pseudouridine746 synthase
MAITATNRQKKSWLSSEKSPGGVLGQNVVLFHRFEVVMFMVGVVSNVSLCFFVVSSFYFTQDLKIVYEDEHIVVVDKPSGVLTVAGRQDNPSLAQAVFEAVDSELASGDHMIVHRLGMDTSGLIVLAKNLEAVRGMNTVFRSRKIERQYEALVVGRVENEEGLISLPIMRDYEFPPYVRVSTYEHQEALLGLLPEVVGAKLLEGPKESITKYQVLSREEYGGQPVTRVALTSISGRYHQLNVHMAAFGHPIVGDTVYGINGDAAANGGLTDAELETLAPNANRASLEVQKAVAAAASNLSACVHAKSLKFRHPVTKEEVELSSNAPF